MKKILVLSLGAMLVLSSCGTYTETGATTGGWFGSVIGSAIGGIAGGPRGSDIGTLVGMAGGVVVGAAIGQAADNAEQRKYEEYRAQRQQRYEQSRHSESRQDYNTYQDNSGFDSSGNGDDRLYGFGEDFGSTVGDIAPAVSSTPMLEIRHPKFVDANRDGVLSRGEEARIVFEIFNTSSKPITHVQPSVTELTGSRHVRVSQNIMVEAILPGKGIRYTAVIRADDRLRDGEAVFRIGVLHRNQEISSQSRNFNVKTSRR